jgi:hypothetical protein
MQSLKKSLFQHYCTVYALASNLKNSQSVFSMNVSSVPLIVSLDLIGIMLLNKDSQTWSLLKVICTIFQIIEFDCVVYLLKFLYLYRVASVVKQVFRNLTTG